MDLKIIAKTIGGLLCILGTFMLLPALYALLGHSFLTWRLMGLSAALLLVGLSAIIRHKDYKADVNHRTGMAVVSLSWFIAIITGALPFYFSDTLPSFVDCIFESASGFTGTGASVLKDIEMVEPSILLWRSITQWLGGMGIILFFIAILPILGIGGVQLFRAETTGPNKDRMSPRVRDTAKSLWLLYISFTAILAVTLKFLGMNGFDAVNHAMTAMATGGFSTKNAGLAFYDSPAIHWVIMTALLLASINFTLHYRVIFNRDFSIFKDSELKGYLLCVLGMTGFITYLLYETTYSDFYVAFRHSLFTVINTSSSTGYSYEDYLHWSPLAQCCLVILMIMGGMTGSTAGGLKCIRVLAVARLLHKELRQVVHPNAVLTVKINDRSIRPNVASSIWTVIFLYTGAAAVITLILCGQNVDIVSSLSATISALSNIGPALGIFGSFDNYSALGDLSKLALSAGMLLGRLEFLTVLVLFIPDFWKK